jgi:hypothetical protein
MSAPRRSPAGAVLLLAVSATVAALLWHMRGPLPLPDGLARTELERWALEEGPAVAAFAVLRVLTLLAAVYSALIGVTGLVAVIARSATLASLAVRLTVPSLRPLVGPLVAFSVTVGSSWPAGAAGLADPAPRPPVMQVGAQPSDVRAAPSGGRGAPVMQLMPPNQIVATALPRALPDATHTVAPGDSFWSIAAEVVAQATGPAPSDETIARYWRALIDANRDQLVVPGDPDLIHPGQVFTLPPFS